MGLKEFVFGYKRYCVSGGGRNYGSDDCVDKCFSTKAEAVKYKQDHCECTIQFQKQRRPFKCNKMKCADRDAQEEDIRG